MSRLRIAVVTLAVLVLAWILLSSLPARGNWHAVLVRDGGDLPFDYRITASRGGIQGWLEVDGGARAFDTIEVHRRRLGFDVMLDGRHYHFDGVARDGHIEGHWRDPSGAGGRWYADRLRRR